MWGWIKRSGTTRTPQKPTEPRPKPQSDPALLAATKALAELAKGQQKLLAQQQETLDKIVTARYDRPVERNHAPMVNEQMPLWAMNDQGDSRPDPEAAEIEKQLSRIATASDAEWVAGE